MSRHLSPLVLPFVAGLLQLALGCGTHPVTHRHPPEPGLSQLILPGGTTTVTLSLQRHRGFLMTDAVKINGRRVGWMAIDTGAGWTCLSHATAERLGITDAPPWKTYRGAQPPDGLYQIDSLQVGAIGLHNHLVGVVDLSSVSRDTSVFAGVLGGDVLGCLPFTLDYQRAELTFYARPSFKPPAGVDEHRLFVNRPQTRGSFIDANRAAGQPQVMGRIDGTPARLMLDTAFDGTVVLRPHFTRKHPRFVHPNPRPVARVAGAAGDAGLDGRLLRRAAVDHVDALGARIYCVGTAVALSDEPDPFQDPSVAILGHRFLSHGRLTFDYASRKVWPVWRGERVPALRD